MSDDTQDPTQESLDDQEEHVGIPPNLKVKRRYTMSPAALEQRRRAAEQPKPGMLGKRNAWKHGQFAKTFLTRLKPCLSTCDRYPCELIEDGRTQPGGDCVDAEELLQIIRAMDEAIKDPKKCVRFKEIASVVLGNNFNILLQIQADIQRDGGLVKSVKNTAHGQQTEYKLHPALYVLPKLIADLGANPDNFMITPKAQSKAQTEEEGVKAITALFQAATKKLNGAKSD